MSRKNDKVILVAHYFMAKSKEKGTNDLSNKKLQKLLYYAQAWSLVLRDKKLFKDKFEAWIHGAAIPVVYRRYKQYGFNPIDEKFDEGELESLSEDEKQLLDEVWDVYGKYDADYLEALNHSEEPWQKARRELQPFQPCSMKIDETTMKNFYGAKLEKSRPQD